MKVSLAWIFDHIDADWKKQDVKDIVAKFNSITAEIESFESVKIDLSTLFIGNVVSASKDEVTLSVPELKQDVTVPARKKSKIAEQEICEGLSFLLRKNNKKFAWATCKDVGLDKDGELPPFMQMSDENVKGGWRKFFEAEDIVFDVDNKSLTHRPDMWGHRGFAREIAAYLELPFIDKGRLLHGEINVKNFNKKSSSEDGSGFTIEIKAEKACERFAGLFFESIENRPSDLFVASRLIKVGVRPINAIVDLTNYVMLDWSQPVHAYDAEKVAKKSLIARMAKDGEKLTLLDGQELKLSSQDLIIADGEKAVGLAGVMGGLHDSIDSSTKSIFFESAHFEAVYIRRTSLRHGVRTDSSARFEKTIDPNQITDAILRFVALCEKVGIKTKITSDIICVGKPFEEKTIGVRHSFLEKRSGVKLDGDDVIEPLKRLGFTVLDTDELLGDVEDVLYTITIPSYRGAKDIESQEDILEEVLRYFGFDRIALTLPALKKEPGDCGGLLRMRKIKNFLAYSARMMEQRNYLYYDEDFLNETGIIFDKKQCVYIKNPVSENNVRLVTSLLPNLFKNIKQNCANENHLRFFESGRTCRMIKGEILEEKRLAGILFEKRSPVDFYEGKQYLMDLFRVCGINESQVVWKKIEEDASEFDWVMPYQSAEIFVDSTRIGIAGKIDNAFLCRLDALPESEAFFFELDAEKLLMHKEQVTVYSPISKFQSVTFDLSFMIPLALTVEQIQAALIDCDDFVERVDLVDFFSNEKWVDKRSAAFRLWVSNPEKTLEKDEIESVRENAIKVIQKLGAELRT